MIVLLVPSVMLTGFGGFTAAAALSWPPLTLVARSGSDERSFASALTGSLAHGGLLTSRALALLIPGVASRVPNREC
jgi:hypothetical protein